MRAQIVARKDYQDAIQSRSLWSLTLLLVVFTAGLAYMLDSSLVTLFWPFFLTFFGDAGSGLRTIEFIHFFVGPAEILIPLLGLMISHKSIAGEIESGSVKFLLSVPLTRWDALLGKMLGRSAVLTTALVAGLVIAGGLVAVLTGRVNLAPYFFLMVITVLFGLAFVSIGVALSAMADSGSRAVIYAIGTYLFLQVAMNFANNFVYMIFNGTFFPPLIGTSGPPDAGGWFFLIDRLDPGGAYKGIVLGLLGTEPPSFAPAFPDGIPVYLQPSVAVLILVLWIILPVGIGYLRFRDADIS